MKDEEQRIKVLMKIQERRIQQEEQKQLLTFTVDKEKLEEERKAVEQVIKEAVDKEREIGKMKVQKEHRNRYEKIWERNRCSQLSSPKHLLDNSQRNFATISQNLP